MYRQIIFLGLLIICSLLSSCASMVQEIQVQPSEYNDIKDAEKIVVSTKDNSQHIVIRYNFTDSTLIGTELMSDELVKPFETHLADISSIKIRGVRDNLLGEIITYEEIKRNITTNIRLLGVLPGAIGGGILGFIPGVLFASDPDAPGASSRNSIFYFPPIMGFVAGGFVGYQIGENVDIKQAIKQIEQKRLKENMKIK